jgi:prenyl protein peptidase
MFAYVQTSILFLGPLYASGLAAKLPGQSNFSFQKDFIDVFVTWVGFRNYFWVRQLGVRQLSV